MRLSWRAATLRSSFGASSSAPMLRNSVQLDMQRTKSQAEARAMQDSCEVARSCSFSGSPLPRLSLYLFLGLLSCYPEIAETKERKIGDKMSSAEIKIWGLQDIKGSDKPDTQEASLHRVCTLWECARES